MNSEYFKLYNKNNFIILSFLINSITIINLFMQYFTFTFEQMFLNFNFKLKKKTVF